MNNTIARNKSNDLYLDEAGNIAMVDGKEAYAQIINATMRTVRGELQLNTRKGLPYFETVFENRNLVEIWRSEAVIAITALPFVKKVVSFDCKIDGDVLQYTSTIETDNGTVEING